MWFSSQIGTGSHLKKSTWLGISSPKTTNHLNNFRFKGSSQSSFKESSDSRATGATLVPSLEVILVNKVALEVDSKVGLGEDSKVVLEEDNKEVLVKEIKGDLDREIKGDKDLDREIKEAKVDMDSKEAMEVKAKVGSDRDREVRGRQAVKTATPMSSPQAIKIPIRAEEERVTSMSDLISWTLEQ